MWLSIWMSHHYFAVAWSVLRDCDPIFRLFPLRGLVVYIGDDDSEVDWAAPTPPVCSDDLLADLWCLSGWETGDIIQPRGLSTYTEIIQAVTDTGKDRWGFLSTGIQRWEIPDISTWRIGHHYPLDPEKQLHQLRCGIKCVSFKWLLIIEKHFKDWVSIKLCLTGSKILHFSGQKKGKEMQTGRDRRRMRGGKNNSSGAV